MLYLSASEVLYQVYVPLPLPYCDEKWMVKHTSDLSSGDAQKACSRVVWSALTDSNNSPPTPHTMSRTGPKWPPQVTTDRHVSDVCITHTQSGNSFLKPIHPTDIQTLTMILFTLLWPKGRTAEHSCVNAVVKQFSVTQYGKKSWNVKTSTGLKSLQGWA